MMLDKDLSMSALNDTIREILERLAKLESKPKKSKKK